MSKPNNEGLRIASSDWLNLKGGEWAEILSGDDWSRALLPYQDEPVRFSGSSLVRTKQHSAELIESSPMVLAVFGRLRQRPPRNKTFTHPR